MINTTVEQQYVIHAPINVVELVVFADVTYIKKLNGQQKVALKINGNDMGCNCGKGKVQGYRRDSQGNKIYDNEKQRSGTLHRMKQTIKAAWEKSQPEQPSMTVKRINKK